MDQGASSIITVESNQRQVTLEAPQSQVTRTSTSRFMVTAGARGLAGASGSGGDLHFTFSQPTPATTWTITHNLGKFPSVSVLDSAGSLVIGGVQHVSSNQCVLTFTGGFSGTAYLN